MRALIVVGLLLFELRCWGRSTSEISYILIRHYRRQPQVRLERQLLTLPLEIEVVSAMRVPRWQEVRS